jgi:hypothetical protein
MTGLRVVLALVVSAVGSRPLGTPVPVAHPVLP